MKILFSHLKKYLQEDIDIQSISESLFRLGHENQYDNEIIDIEFTPNKGDCLSVYGLARDLNSIHKIDLNNNIYEGDINEFEYNFKNKETEFCPKIQFLKIEIEEVPKEYKSYLESYFINLGISKNNFFTDVSNYLAYELGQPTHCYDFNKVKDGISLTSISEITSFKTLIGKDIKLFPGEKVFKKNDEIINLAGVMGGESTKCDVLSKIALVECAFFNPDMIIGKSTKYNLFSDAAYKFERGVDINGQEYALRRFINIIADHAKIKSVEIKKFNSSECDNKEIACEYSRINSILGLDIKTDRVNDILTSLGFKVRDSFIVPSWRSDIESINDLAEEIARVIGYDQIPNSTIEIPDTLKNKNSCSKVNRIRNYLIGKGFNEVINDPFVAKNEPQSIKVDNPLDSNRAFLRINIIDSLVKNLDYNEKRQKEAIKFFEISDIYTSNNNKKITSKKVISIIVSGRQGLNYSNFNKKLDHNYLKGVISSLGLNDAQIKEIQRSSFNSKIKNKIYYIESAISDIDMNLLEKDSIDLSEYSFSKFTPISDLPSSQRDISISLDNANLLENLLSLMFDLDLSNMKDLFIFDFYHNKDKNILKVGLRFIFQSHNKTLNEVEIDSEMQKVFDEILNLDGVSIPGLILK